MQLMKKVLSEQKDLSSKNSDGNKRLVYIYFLIPFLIVFIGTKFLTTEFKTFHYNDEVVHYNIIMKFVNEFPKFDLINDYYSATTPLYHIVFSVFVKIIGTELYKLRIINLIISYLAICVLFNFLYYRIKISFKTSVAFSFIFLFSPYFFGASFILLTDNFAILMCILSIDYLFRFYQSQVKNKILISILFMAITVLIRQSFVWLSLSLAIFILISKIKLLNKIYLYLLMGLSLLPLLYVFYIWHSLLPPALTEVHFARTLNFSTITLLISIIGLYYSILNYPVFIKLFTKKALFNIKVIAIIIIGILWLVIFPTHYESNFDGYLMRISSILPNLLSTGIIFWFLFPIGLLSIYKSNEDSIDSFTLILLASFLVVNISSKIMYQKYFDFFALIIVFLFLKSSTDKKQIFITSFVIMLLFIIYAISYFYRY
jgi:hypothetical protein